MQSPKPRTVIKHHATQLVVVASSLLLANVLPAQTSTTAAKPAETDNEVVRLSEFNVSTERDYGYRASNSISGTRTDTPIRDIPMNIQVFTKDLYEDLHITNSVDLEAYNAAVTNGGADRHSSNVIQQSYQNFIFRGFRQNWGLRDGIREYDPVDTQNLARIEYVKGPAAALYGLSYPGGVQQNITKEADLSKSFADLRASYGSYGEYRGTVDANVTENLNGQKFAIRVNAADGRTHDEREHSAGKQNLEAVTLTWLATPTTKVQAFYEHAYRGIPNGLGYFTKGTETDANGVSLGNHSDIPLQIVHPNIPWTWNWANGDDIQDIDTHLYRAAVTQSIGDNFSVNGYVQYSKRLNIQGNGWDANGSGGSDSWESPNSGWINPGGPNERIQSTYAYRDWGNQMHAYGATGVYKLDVDAGGLGKVKNTFVFGGASWQDKVLSRESNDTAPIPLVYAVQANIPITIPYGSVPSTVVPDVLGGPNGNGYHHENNSNTYYFANWQSGWFNNRFKAILGFNHTSMKLLQWNTGASPSPDISYTASKVSPLYSGMFDITKDISVFALHATSLFPDTTKDSFGNTFSPQVGSSYEAGIKVDLLEGKISGTISVYEIKQTGGSQSAPNHENRDTATWDTLTAAERAVRYPGLSRSDLLARGDIIQGGEQTSKGVEWDVIFQPTREWQIVTSLAHNNEEITKSADASTLGESVPQHIVNQYAVLTKYTFADGPTKGLSVGLGFHGGSKALMDYQSWGGKTIARYEPARSSAEVFAEYRVKLGNYNTLFQLNVKNLTKTSDYVGWQATGSPTILATQRYKVPTPTTYNLTVGVSF